MFLSSCSLVSKGQVVFVGGREGMSFHNFGVLGVVVIPFFGADNLLQLFELQPGFTYAVLQV